jgi:hypothetical protein
MVRHIFQNLLHAAQNKWHRNYLIRRFVWVYFLLFFSKLCFVSKRFCSIKSLSDENVVFVVGCSRSGTTIFADTIGLHPQICNYSEAPQIFELDYYNRDIDHFKSPLTLTEFDVFRVKLFLSLKLFLSRKSVLVNKHPENSLRVEWLKTIFPRAKFVHICRDGRAVVASHLSRTKKDYFRANWPFGQFPKPKNWQTKIDLPLTDQFIYQWNAIVTDLEHTFEKPEFEGQTMKIRYEDFCENSEMVLEGFYNFCGVSGAVNSLVKEKQNIRSHNKNWKNGLTSAEVETISSGTIELNRRLGYDV